MWFADLVCNVEWFAQRNGVLGSPRSRARAKTEDPPLEVELLLYGSDFQVDHLRILFHSDSKDEVDRCLDNNIQYWVASLEVSTGLVQGRPCSVESFPGSAQFFVAQGEGDENAQSLILKPQPGSPAIVDYHALSQGLVNWPRKSISYLFYLRRFLDPSLPLDSRWLNGYRVAEWHFTKGKDKLQNVREWRELLELYRADLESFRRNNKQTLHGLIEDARALAAHAVMDERTLEERIKMPGDAVRWTFAVIEKIVTMIMNDKAVSLGLVELIPRYSTEKPV